MASSSQSHFPRPESPKGHKRLLFDDLRCQLDLIIQNYDDLANLTRAVMPCTSTVTANTDLLKRTTIGDAQPPKLALDTPSQIKAATELQARGINPATGEKERIVMRAGITRKIKSKEKDTAGKGWFDMPKTDLTPELKNDLRVLSMRDALDSKRFYKKDKSSASVPKYSQVGHIVEGNTEFHCARTKKKDRKRTLVEELLAEETASRKHKRKYDEIMAQNVRNKSLGRKKRKKT